MSKYDYDLFVIGAGSGGVRAARIAAELGKRVGIAEEYRFGGTCVIRGCVPKKLFFYASGYPEHFALASGFGWRLPNAGFDWSTLMANKDREIARLEAIYRRNVQAAGVDMFDSRARLIDRNTILLEKDARTVVAEQILIATGARPASVPRLPGHELCISSDQAFHLEQLPQSVVIAGGGYIAVEFANIFHGLGVETMLVYRGPEILARFDLDLRRELQRTMARKGIRMCLRTSLTRVDKRADGRIDVQLSDGKTLTAAEVMLAVGRLPNTADLGLEDAGVDIGGAGEVLVDSYSRTSVDNIWAVGDVTNRVQLTPVAIHEAMCFVETAFKGNPVAPDHGCIATAIFSQPEIGTVGLTEDEAARNFENVEVYRTAFRPMRHATSDGEDRMLIKLIVDSDSNLVLGAHVLGADAGEMAQLLGIPIATGITKERFDRTMAVHPTAAEELVTLYRPSYLIRKGERVR